MDTHDRPSRSRFKVRLLALLQGGAGSLVLATTVLVAPPEGAATPSPESVLERAGEARARLVKSLEASAQPGGKPLELAWWGKAWGNGGGHPAWDNWPNGWQNWNDWGNW